MEKKNKFTFSRRDALKSLATLPVLGYFGFRFSAKYKNDILPAYVKRKPIQLPQLHAVQIPAAVVSAKGDVLRVGIVGNGMRGPQIFRALGYADETWVKKNTKNGQPNSMLRNFLEQDDLNVEISGVCDTFTGRAEDAVKNAVSEVRSGGAKAQTAPKIYPTYRQMLADDQLDAIVILAPDHWHKQMAVDAARAGKHVYLEKPMCQTADEAAELKKVVHETGITLQVGHQNRQQASYIKARELIEKGVLGEVCGVETYTNRNNDHGAWIRGIPTGANLDNVNWKEFLGSKSWEEPDLDKYFNWQKWFKFGTGPAGNQFTHEFDCVNQVMNLGIPKRVTAMGGNFYFKDSRDIPDVLNCVFEYPDKNLMLTYDCTLKSSKLRDKTFLGSDASMEVNVGVAVYPDKQSKKYKEKIHDFDSPIYTYNPKNEEVDAVTSATAKYYHERGFGYTYHDGKRIDATYLHMKEWLYCIRNKQEPSCSVDKGFEETVTFYMANLAYLEKRVVEWDELNQKIG